MLNISGHGRPTGTLGASRLKLAAALALLSLVASLPIGTAANAAGEGSSSSPGPASLSPGLASSADFVIGDWPMLEVPWQRLRYNGRRVLPARTEGLVDERGVPLRTYRRAEGAVYNPTVLAEEGMMRLDSWLRTEDPVHLRQARRIAKALDATALEEGGRRWQPHPYSRFGYEPGWVNANSHGLVLSFFSRSHQVTGDQDDRARADRLFAAYDAMAGQERWFTAVVDDHLWFEHYPDSFRGQVLNAHLNALFGLYDYWRISGSEAAARLFRGGVATVRDELERFRRPGDLSAYSLRTDFVSEHYHDTHIKQLRILARMTGDGWFRDQAELFEDDGRAWWERQRDAAAE